MSRIVKILGVVGLSSVYVMQVPCNTTGDGFSILPNIGGIPGQLLNNVLGGII